MSTNNTLHFSSIFLQQAHSKMFANSHEKRFSAEREVKVEVMGPKQQPGGWLGWTHYSKLTEKLSKAPYGRSKSKFIFTFSFLSNRFVAEISIARKQGPVCIEICGKRV